MLRPGSWSVAICDDSVVISSGSLDVMSFDIMTGDIFGLACLVRCMSAPDSAFTSVYLLEELGG